MQSNRTVLVNCTAYTGDAVIDDAVIDLEGDRITAAGPRRRRAAPASGAARTVDLEGATVAPGFVDIQVNGGGDILFNDDPSPAALHAIAAAHARSGTTSIVPTYITGPVDGMRAALRAVAAAHARDPLGILGIHFEGPAISRLRAGVHDPAFITDRFPVEILDHDRDSASGGGVVLVTLAPEVTGTAAIRALRQRGAVVSIGHTDATYEQAKEAFAQGATCVTHLFNGMSPLAARQPGTVGAALEDAGAWVGIIADGHHCHAASILVALRAKPAGKCLLVTDAMPPAGGSSRGYTLGPYHVEVRDGRCVVTQDTRLPGERLVDGVRAPGVEGTLAGSAIDMARAVRHCVSRVGIPLEAALKMASLHPAQMLGLDGHLGRIAPGYVANLVVLGAALEVRGAVRSGAIEVDL